MFIGIIAYIAQQTDMPQNRGPYYFLRLSLLT
jgi:hypothetical protein